MCEWGWGWVVVAAVAVVVVLLHCRLFIAGLLPDLISPYRVQRDASAVSQRSAFPHLMGNLI